jgi:very-short-patch-repair endonuclease
MGEQMHAKSGGDHAPPALFRNRARKLRQESTDAERKLWSHLRNHGMGVKFRRQHPIGQFIVDLVSLEAKLIVEIDGGQHDRDADRTADTPTDRYLEERGYRVVRFWNNEALNEIDAVLSGIDDLLQGHSPGAARRPLPSSGEVV